MVKILTKEFWEDRKDAFSSFIRLRFKDLKEFPVDGIIAGLGIIGLVAWVVGVEEAFLAIGFTFYAVYNTFRLNNGGL